MKYCEKYLTDFTVVVGFNYPTANIFFIGTLSNELYLKLSDHVCTPDANSTLYFTPGGPCT